MSILSPERVETIFAQLCLPFRFSAAERIELNTISIVDKPGVLCFPTPEADELSLLNLRRLLGVNPKNPPSFFDHPWYLEESFGEDACLPGWHMIQMEPDPCSVEQTYNDCCNNMLGFTAPSVIEVVIMLFFQYVATGQQLLSRKHTWCRDKASLGRRVTAGAFGRNGLFVSAHPDLFTSKGLGMCGKVRLPGDELCR